MKTYIQEVYPVIAKEQYLNVITVETFHLVHMVGIIVLILLILIIMRILPVSRAEARLPIVITQEISVQLTHPNHTDM